jgi:hypothetical protein
VGRARSWWNGTVRTVTWSPWFGRRVISVEVEVMPGGGTPESQRGRLVHCAMTPESARSLAARLVEYAVVAEASLDEEARVRCVPVSANATLLLRRDGHADEKE